MQIQKEKPKAKEKVDERGPRKTDRAEKLKAELDDLLDEIDDILSTQDEDFAAQFKQLGGQ